ncbi:MAG: YCF48-related protein, partial [Bacteroidales bacterium]
MKNLILFFTLAVMIMPLRAQFSWVNPLPQGNTLNAIHFIDNQNGWAVGDHGTLLKTADGGSGWQIVGSPVNENLQDVFFLHQDHGW